MVKPGKKLLAELTVFSGIYRAEKNVLVRLAYFYRAENKPMQMNAFKVCCLAPKWEENRVSNISKVHISSLEKNYIRTNKVNSL